MALRYSHSPPPGNGLKWRSIENLLFPFKKPALGRTGFSTSSHRFGILLGRVSRFSGKCIYAIGENPIILEQWVYSKNTIYIYFF